ncbi:ISKra4 family transposase [Parashewanella spongiae]|nr:ISKra4 family transposase [Parashewanella spongiae]
MKLAYSNSLEFSFFSEAKLQFERIISHLEDEQVKQESHGEVEAYIDTEGTELLRCLLQGFLDIKTAEEPRQQVCSNRDIALNHLKNNCKRNLESLFGTVTMHRKGYSQRRCDSVFPMDGELNLSKDKYSDGVRLRLATEAVKGSYDDAVSSIDTTTGAHVPKRQARQIVQDIAQDFDGFYLQQRYLKPENTSDLLVLTMDGKGIVMQPNSLREGTQKAAKQQKLKGRLSAGEKKDRKRMAEVAAVYTTKPLHRTPESIMSRNDNSNVRPLRVPPRNKRVWASVERSAATVIEEAFLEALERDPTQSCQWVVLVDGHPHQLKQIYRVMKKLNINATVVMDFIHVLEYLWKAAWCLFEKDDPEVEDWIEKRATEILRGNASQVAKGLGISATKRKLKQREGINKCIGYLLKNKSRLEYGKALEQGFPIASGVIEGACRHLINDRLDITGARWSLEGAEAILKLRSLRSSGDIEKYWEYHKKQSKQRLYRCG